MECLSQPSKGCKDRFCWTCSAAWAWMCRSRCGLGRPPTLLHRMWMTEFPTSCSMFASEQHIQCSTCMSAAPSCMWSIKADCNIADCGKCAGRNGLTRSALSTASGSTIALAHGKFYLQVTPASNHFVPSWHCTVMVRDKHRETALP